MTHPQSTYTLRDFFRLDRKLAREVYHLAYPVVLGMASITAIGVTDTMMVGRLSAEALAATGQAAMLLWAAGWIMRSVEIAVQALVARRFGEQSAGDCGKVLDNGLILVSAFSVFWILLLGLGAPFLMSLLSTNDRVIGYAVSYIQIFVLSFPAAACFYVIRGFFSGIGKTRIYMITSVIMMSVNVVANYVLIFGHFGMPRLEIRGAAIGSVIAIYSATILIAMILIGMVGKKYHREFSGLRLSNLNWILMKEIIRLSSPNAFRGVMVIGGLAIFYAMVDRLDVIQVAVVNVVLNIQSISFMPGHGFGVAASALIGQNLGAGEPEKAERAGYESVKLGMIWRFRNSSSGCLRIIRTSFRVRFFHCGSWDSFNSSMRRV
jgi:putative MATE family efflux protein